MAVDLKRLCMGCMNELPHPQAVCPHCNRSRQTEQNGALQLAQETRLKNPGNGKEYLIGKTIGQGGFGIVYVAWDIVNERKVAVKEYYPYSKIVNRTRSNTVNVMPNTQENIDFFNHQKKRFRQEAQKMMLFSDSPNIVNVFEFFEANNTAYIVMEFIEGQTFAQVLERVPNKRMSLETVLANFKPIVDILERIHTTPFTDEDGWHSGIIHRDISPENIIYAVDGSVKLLDFGAARSSDPTNSTGIVKHGYAPWEQYLSKGSAATQGSWTDVYAFAATIYQAITGKLPPKSIDRSVKDTIEMPSSLGVDISSEQERVLLKGLAVDYKNRYQSIKQFYDDLMRAIYKSKMQEDKPKKSFEQAESPKQSTVTESRANSSQASLPNIRIFLIGIVCVLAVALIFVANKISTVDTAQSNTKTETTDTAYRNAKTDLSLSGIDLGVSILDAEKIFGKPQKIRRVSDEEMYSYNGLTVYAHDGHVSRILTIDPMRKTLRGLQVGSNYSEVIDKYGANYIDSVDVAGDIMHNYIYFFTTLDGKQGELCFTLRKGRVSQISLFYK